MAGKGYTPIDMDWMAKALILAEKAAAVGEVPVGALLVKDGVVIGEGFNTPINSCDPTAHAEIMALRNAASKLKNYRLPETTLYVTIEPCTMCVGALIHARVSRLVYGAKVPRAGAVESQLELPQLAHFNHKLDVVGGVLSERCGEFISAFFRNKRSSK
jgi:tRNA(adenine34) deaminase